MTTKPWTSALCLIGPCTLSLSLTACPGVTDTEGTILYEGTIRRAGGGTVAAAEIEIWNGPESVLPGDPPPSPEPCSNRIAGLHYRTTSGADGTYQVVDRTNKTNGPCLRVTVVPPSGLAPATVQGHVSTFMLPDDDEAMIHHHVDVTVSGAR
jgi:hypothetical protein